MIAPGRFLYTELETHTRQDALHHCRSPRAGFQVTAVVCDAQRSWIWAVALRTMALQVSRMDHDKHISLLAVSLLFVTHDRQKPFP